MYTGRMDVQFTPLRSSASSVSSLPWGGWWCFTRCLKIRIYDKETVQHVTDQEGGGGGGWTSSAHHSCHVAPRCPACPGEVEFRFWTLKLRLEFQSSGEAGVGVGGGRPVPTDAVKQLLGAQLAVGVARKFRHENLRIQVEGIFQGSSGAGVGLGRVGGRGWTSNLCR